MIDRMTNSTNSLAAISHLRSALCAVLAFIVIAVVIAFGTATQRVWAQESAPATSPTPSAPTAPQRTLSIGGYVGGQANFHAANFPSLRGVPTVLFADTQFQQAFTAKYSDAVSAGFSVGVLAEMPLSDAFALALRAGYGTHSAPLRATETLRIGFLTSAGSAVQFADAKVGFALDVPLTMLSLEPMLVFKPLAEQSSQTDQNGGGGGLKLYAGFRAGLVLQKSYTQTEIIVEPSEALAVFNNNNKNRNPQSGSAVPDMATLLSGVSVGAGYEFALAPSLFLAPEVFYTFGLTPLATGLQWNMNVLRGAVSVRYALPPLPPPPPEPPPAPTPPPVVAQAQSMVAKVSAFSVDTSGVDVPLVQIKVEEFVSRQMYPVLPFVFFDQSASVIPARYHRLSSDEVSTFNENKFYNTDALKVYYEVLNVIGKRLRDKPKAKITLIGCNDNAGPEASNTALSKQRAESVRQYLKDVWGVDFSRVDMQPRNLPEKATVARDGTPEDDERRREENRRVEINSDDWEIVRPSLVYDTLLVPSAPVIKFKMDVENAVGGVAKSTLRAFQGARTLKQYATLGQYDKEFNWNTAREQQTVPRTEDKMKFSFEAVDNDGNVAMPVDSIPVEQVTIRKKRSLRIKDKEIDTYRLILFDFDSPAVLKDNQRILQDIVLPNMKPTSVAQVSGFTDKLGSADVNQRLSEGRAKSVSELLKGKTQETTARGVGARQLIYPNDIPEGRFLSRTVEVRVETPIEQ
jgi:outer membrane protein OmpA-like peptidoglycan-associated protein